MSSKRAMRRRACAGKRQYPDIIAAREACARALKLRHQLLTPYRCDFCHQLHIGHPQAHRTHRPTS